MAAADELYRRYRSGELTPDQKKQYEDAVSSGRVDLPEGGSLGEEGFIKAFEGAKSNLGMTISPPKPKEQKTKFNWDAVDKGIEKDIIRNQASNDNVIDTAIKTDPAAYAETRKLSKDTGLPHDLVERNKEDIVKGQKSEKIKAILQYAPILADKFKEPDFAQLAHDDVENLSSMENSLKSLGQISKGLTETTQELTPSDIEKARSDIKAQLQGKPAPLPSHEFAPRALPEANIPIYPGYGFGIGKVYARPPKLGEFLGAVKKTAVPLMKQTKSALEIAATENLITAPETTPMFTGLQGMGLEVSPYAEQAIKEARKQAVKDPLEAYKQATQEIARIRPEGMTPSQELFYDTSEAGIKMAPALAITALTRNPWAFAVAFYPDVYTNKYAQLTVQFPNMSPEEKNLHSNVSAGIEILTEKLPMEKVIQFGKPFFNRLVATVITEGGQEASSQVLQDLYDKATTNPGITMQQMLNNAGYSFAVGGALGGGMTVVTQPVALADSAYQRYSDKYKKEVSKADKSINDNKTISENMDSANSSQLRKTSPEVFKDFVEKNLGAENNVYIAPKDAVGFFQSKPELIAQLEEQAPDTAASIIDSLDSGSDVVIPKADFFTYFPEYYSELEGIVRNDQDGLTVAEAEAFKQESPKTFEEEAAKALEEDKKQVDFENSANKVAANVKQQIVSTGRYTPDVADKYAVLHKAFASTMAKKTGETPEEFYNRFNLKFQAGEQVAPGSLTQKDVADTLGIQVSEVTPEDYQRAVRSQLQAQKDLLPTVGGGRAKQGWASATRISRKGGEPITVYRGAKTSLNAGSFSPERLGGASQNPSSGLGVWFTPNQGEAATYGKTEPFHLDIRNPKVIKVEDLPGFDSVQDATKYREELRKQGYDGIAVDARHLEGPIHFIAFDPHQAIHPESKKLFQGAKLKLGKVSTISHTEYGKEFKTGVPVTFNFVHNTESATKIFGIPTKESPYGRGYEPSGRYITLVRDVREFGRDRPNMISGTITFNNPLVVNNKDLGWKKELSDAYSGLTGKKLSQALIKDGYDGVVTVDVGKTPDRTHISEILDLTSFDVRKALFQGKISQSQDLYVAHNLSADNLVHAEKMGGLAVHSLAIVRTGAGFEGFGEISLIADKTLLKDPYAKTFGADIYSPRYPTVNYKVNWSKYNKILDSLNSELESDGLAPVSVDIEDRGPQELYYNTGARYLFLKSIDQAPKRTFKKKEAIPSEFKKFKGSQYSIASEDEFRDLAKKYYNDKAIKTAEEMRDYQDGSAAEKQKQYDYWLNDWQNTYFDEDGDVRIRFLDQLANKVSEYHKPKAVDTYSLDKKMASKFKDLDSQQKFKDWIENKFSDAITGEQIFQGYTNSGNRRYVAHTLDNVVKIMKKELRGGENFNYGVGTIRSAIAPQFKSITAMQKARGKIVPSDVMDKLKEETSNEFTDIVDKLRPYYKYETGNFGFLDAAAENLFEMAKGKGLQDFEDVPADVIKSTAEFLAKLRDMPTEYFETKIQRAVGLDEFKAAVVPKGTSDKVKSILQKNGLDIVEYDSKKKGDRSAQIANYGKSQDILFQKERGAFIPEQNIIQFYENADLSTALHESAHFFLEAINSMPEMNQEMDTIFNWFGTTREAWNQMSLDEKRDSHEKFARGFEAYLFEGKAPSEELRTAFQRFRDWLINVYKNIRNLNVKLTPEVRQVFDRMLATDEQIKQAEMTDSYAPLFKTIEESGMSQQQWDEYNKLNEDQRNASRENLETRSVKDMKWMSNAKARVLRSLQKDAKEKRQAVRDEVAAQVDKEKVYVAQNFFRRGEWNDDKGELQKTENHRLDIDALNEMFPYNQEFDIPDWRKLGHGKYGMIGKGGLDPTDVAHQFHYSSADEMIRDILESPAKKDYIEAVTDQVMLERYGDLNDPIKMQRAAEEAIHNQVHTRFLHTELTALTKGAGNKNILSKAARDYAQKSIAEKLIRNIKPNQYLLSQTRSGNQAMKSLAKGDREQAIDHKRAQVLNDYLYREAVKAQKEVEKDIRYVKKFTKEGVRKNISKEYLDQIDDLLGTFEFKNISAKAEAKRKSLAQFIQAQEEAGFEPIIDEALVNETKRKNYKDLTLGELRGHIDSIKNIEHLGRLKNKLLTAKDRREFQQRVDEAKLSIQLLANRKAKVRASPNDVLGQVGAWWRSYLAAHRKFASILREMDGGMDNGVMWNLLLRGMNESGDTETEMKAEATQDLAKMFNQVKIRAGIGNLRSPKYLIPGTDFSLTDEQRIMVALNWGNEGNRQRLMDGGIEGKPRITEDEVNKILDTLTQKEWGLVQGVWDFLETYRDRIGEQEQRLTGKTPKWVDPSPIETKYGPIRGGYFPAKYDTVLSTRSDQLEAATDLRMGMKGVFGSAATKSGYAKARANEVKDRPLLLSFNAITQHTNEVIHRLSWQDWLTDANRVVKSLDGSVRKFYGPEILKEIQETIRDIAKGDAPATTPVEKAINHLRVGSTITGMGWRISTALIQPTGLAQSWVRIGGANVAHGLRKYISNPLKSSREANEKSKFMRDRDRTQQREINEVLNTLRVGDKMAKFKASYFYLIQKMQRTVDLPTWWGAYDKALKELNIETAIDETQRKAIDEKAVALADQAVVDSQSGGMTKDLARVQRGSPLYKLLTNFYSYFSATYNLNVEAFRKMDIKNNPASALTFLGDMLVLNSLPVLMTVALKEILRGDCGDDIECLGRNLTDEQISYMFGQMVLLREIGAGVQVAAGGKAYGYSGPAGLRPLADIYKLGVQASQGEADEAFRRALLQTTGALLHLPTGQLNTMIDGFTAVENGEVEGARAVLAPLAGAPRK